jgi:hypothetical protein
LKRSELRQTDQNVESDLPMAFRLLKLTLPNLTQPNLIPHIINIL